MLSGHAFPRRMPWSEDRTGHLEDTRRRNGLATLLYEPDKEKETTNTIHEPSGGADFAWIGSSARPPARHITALVLTFDLRLSIRRWASNRIGRTDCFRTLVCNFASFYLFLRLFLFLLDCQWPPRIDACGDNEDCSRYNNLW